MQNSKTAPPNPASATTAMVINFQIRKKSTTVITRAKIASDTVYSAEALPKIDFFLRKAGTFSSGFGSTGISGPVSSGSV